MPRFAANLSMMFTEHAFLDRFAAGCRGRFPGGGVPVPLCREGRGYPRGAGRGGAGSGAVQLPARRLGCRRTGHVGDPRA